MTKNACMLLAYWALLYYGAIGTVKFVMEDEEIKLKDMPGMLAQKAPLLVKIVCAMVPKLLEYFRPDFHPYQMNNDYLATEYFEANKKYFQKAG